MNDIKIQQVLYALTHDPCHVVACANALLHRQTAIDTVIAILERAFPYTLEKSTYDDRYSYIYGYPSRLPHKPDIIYERMTNDWSVLT